MNVIFLLVCHLLVFCMSLCVLTLLPFTTMFALGAVILMFPVAVINDNTDYLFDYFKEIALMPVEVVKFFYEDC